MSVLQHSKPNFDSKVALEIPIHDGRDREQTEERSSRSSWCERRRETTMSDAMIFAISKMHAADPYSRSKGA
jgi:hypothetical protein